MNTGASSIADGFITEYMDKSVVYDYFAGVLNPRCQLQEHFLDHAENQMSHGRTLSISSMEKYINGVIRTPYTKKIFRVISQTHTPRW
jgi:hypothetical protein